jgi:N-acetylornithine carbamoyltransferase
VVASLGNARFVNSLEEGLKGAQVVYAKSWGGVDYYGRWEEEKAARARYKHWRVDTEKMSLTMRAFFMHCMPLRRNVEVTDDVLESPACAIYDQAENRLHVQKALLAQLLQ